MAETNFIVFRSAGQMLALGAEYSRQVLPLEQLYALPGVGGGILGLIPAAGRVLPVLDLHRLTALGDSGSDTPGSLALLCEVAGEQVALPADTVIGFVQDDFPTSPELLSQETLLGGYSGGGHKARVINPHALLAAVQNRILSA